MGHGDAGVILSRVLITFAAHGLELTHATPGVGYVPNVQQGRAYAVIDSAAAINNVTTDDDGRRIVEVGHNHQVGALVVPVNGSIIIPELGFTWITSQQDFDADGSLTGDDAALWLSLYDLQSPLCDFNADNQVNSDDFVLWRIAVEAARPDYLVSLDVDKSGFVNANDFDLFTHWFISGDPLADFNSDGFVNGDDHDAFTQAFTQGTHP